MFKRGPFSAAALLAGAMGRGAIVALVMAPVAQAQPAANLPKPFVSRSLDATLLPVTPAVRSAFRLSPSAKGVVVVSTDPRGVAAKSNIKPGDVIGLDDGTLWRNDFGGRWKQLPQIHWPTRMKQQQKRIM